MGSEMCIRDSGETATNDVVEFFAVVRDSAARTAERECRANDRGKADFLEKRAGIFEIGDGLCLRLAKSEVFNDAAEFFAIFRAVNHAAIGTDHFNAVLLQNSIVEQFARAVERGLSTERWQQCVDWRAEFLLANDDFFDGFRGDRLDVRSIAERRIRHDRRGIRVHEDNAIALFAKTLARLRAGVIELAALTNDDGAGTDDQDRVDVFAARHSVVGLLDRPPATGGAGRGSRGGWRVMSERRAMSKGRRRFRLQPVAEPRAKSVRAYPKWSLFAPTSRARG